MSENSVDPLPPLVLVVIPDTFADEREMYATFLKHGGFDVVECGHVGAALRLTRHRPPAAVVTRIVQPGSPWNGVELTRRIKEDPRTSQIPVIVITTRIEPHFRSGAEGAGCDSFLLLPSNPEILADELRRLIGRTAATR